MEKKTKHGEWEGHRLFCRCDGAEWEDGRGQDTTGGHYPPCSRCNMFPWYYLNSADEPKQEG